MFYSFLIYYVLDIIKIVNNVIVLVWFGKNELGKFFDECGLKFFFFYECGGWGNLDMMKGCWGGWWGWFGGWRG